MIHCTCPLIKYSIVFLFLHYFMFAQQLAFPTAEGSARFAKGGRGGTVYEVTNLSNSGPGSLVDAVSVGNRTIVFRISGTIELGSIILKPKSNISIAGQTAPGDGICIKGRISIGAVSNVIIRYIRVRVDAGAANSSGDAIDIDQGTNIIIDHISASYSRDEGISCQETSDKITVQWCMISEALTFESHSYGSLIRGDYGDTKTYHHNLYAHNNNRNPRPGNYTASTTDPEGLHFDFRNNVMYNWKGSTPGYNADKIMTSRYNFIGNVCISGLESTVSNKMFQEDAVNAYAYFADNSYNGVVPSDPWSLVIFNGFTQEQIDAYKARSYLIPLEPVTTTSPEQAKTDVLASAGASFPARDIIDNRIVNDVLNGTGRSIVSTDVQPEGGWPVLHSTTPPLDTDHDGMPDDWEIARGLDPNNETDRNIIRTDGYTQLEAYIDGLTGEIATGVAENDSQLPGDFKLHQNYPNPFNPSTRIKYDLPRTGKISMKVYDVYGREIATLVDGIKPAGLHQTLLNGHNLSNGVYFVRLNAEKFSQTIKLILVK